jgi:hypothetical protein
MTRIEAGHVEPRWLSLRGPADARARTTFGAGLAADLARHLLSRLSGDGQVSRLVDVGAGTGAGATWLRRRLPVRQDWRLLDQDPHLLEMAPPAVEGWARGIAADVAELPGLLADRPAHVVSCQALLDILTADQLDDLLGTAAASGAAVLLGLSVTGEVALTPSHPEDGPVAEAFNAHQRRAGRLGPDAAAHATAVLRDHGYAVTTAATPWQLGPSDVALVRAWLRGYARAACEQQPEDADRFDAWHRSRDRSAGDGGLDVVVGHLDILGLPAGAAVAP